MELSGLAGWRHAFSSHRARTHASQPAQQKVEQPACEALPQLADTSDDLFTASLDFLPSGKEAVDQQAEKRNVHTDEEHCVHDLVATHPLIGTGYKKVHPSEDSFREKEAAASSPPLH